MLLEDNYKNIAMHELEAKEAIRDLVLKYCRAVDRRDYKTLAKLYHESSYDDHSPMFSGSGADFVDWLPSMLSTMQVTSHQVSNHYIKVKGSKAEGECYCVSYHLTNDNTEIIISGRYLDKYIFDNGRWQFKHRKIVLDFNEIRPALCDFESEFTAGVPVGASIDKDPSSTFFEFFEK